MCKKKIPPVQAVARKQAANRHVICIEVTNFNVQGGAIYFEQRQVKE